MVNVRKIAISLAKRRLFALLDEVERGETVIITRRGRAIARLVPDPLSTAAKRRKLIEGIEEFRRGLRNPLSLEEILAWRHEGHKY
jgi:prevent-host-death family protein